ncbi:hypothetical protein A9Q99_20615 [Gammaproteobacteria bacterium 45_16_T64]|nr:hypothetical protein A9Q99_20615 [Gammaproteobacteria bacterium 45_16_T64]
MKKVIVIIFCLILAIGCGLFYSLDNHVVKTQKQTLVKGKTQQKIDDFEVKHHAQLTKIIQDVNFSGGDDEMPVPSPDTNEYVIDGGFVVHTPNISEDDIRSQAVTERLEFTLGNLKPAILDAMMNEYQENHTSVLSDMGVEEHCDAAGCGYQIKQGPFLDVVSQAGISENDTLLTLNNVVVGEISSYQQFKDIVFSNANGIQLTVNSNGNVKNIEVPIMTPKHEG